MACLTFLTIPLDVRENVLSLVLFSPYNPYPIPPLAEDTRQQPIRRPFEEYSFFKGWYWHYAPCNLSYELPESFAAHNSSLILSLVNRQLKDEVTALIQRLEDKPDYHRYTLDILFVNEQNFWPTWICLPPRPIRNCGDHVIVSQVDVTFRIAGGKKPGRSIFDGRTGVPPPIEFCVYHILERFLRAGPFLETPDESKADIDYNIAALKLDFTAILAEGEEFYTDADEDWEDWQEENGRSLDRGRRKASESTPEGPPATKIMHPQWLASDVVIRGLESLSQMSYHTAEFGAMLYERIGNIHVTVEGRKERNFILNNVLRELNPSDPGHTFGNIPREERLPYFNRWKKETQERRFFLFGEACSTV
ncbi:hypothetical protein DL96DRAFT_1027807 [Flagelloscypha sp. PMI_526]|nr:hypothetical protein DL96DRAFT_1027807 [Flagelloscypha sp. PMI_526]